MGSYDSSTSSSGSGTGTGMGVGSSGADAGSGSVAVAAFFLRSLGFLLDNGGLLSVDVVVVVAVAVVVGTEGKENVGIYGDDDDEGDREYIVILFLCLYPFVARCYNANTT